MISRKALVRHIHQDIDINDLDAPEWPQGVDESVSVYWSGKEAEADRRFSFVVLWSDNNLYVKFDAASDGKIICANDPLLTSKTIGLWDRDVCEIFIAPDVNEPRRYFEFEVAPTGEWLDVAIDLTGGERVSDWEYASGMQVAARIENGRAAMAIKIPFTAFGKAPKSGDVWLGNVFRCVGADPGRGYLAWNPTLTELPSYHVPERFAEFHFM